MKLRRGALFGYGFIAEKGHVPAYQTGGAPFEVGAVVDICEARRQRVREALPGVPVFESAEAFFASDISRSLDFVDISTPPATHAAIAREALSRGLHVLCEKPVTTNAREATELLGLATRVGRVFYPSHNYSHAPVVKAVRGLLTEGAIGKVHLATLETFRSTHARGVDEWRPDWRREKQHAGGGIAMDHGSHTFYLAFEWMGGYPTHLSASSHVPDDHDTEDDITFSLRFRDGGLVRSHLTWRAGSRKVIYTIHGDRGAIRVEDDRLELARRHGTAGKFTWETTERSIVSNWMDASHVTWFGSLFHDFSRAMNEGVFVPKTARDAHACVSLIETAYQSADHGSRELPITYALSDG
jgi:predicted dehydrogenase